MERRHLLLQTDPRFLVPKTSTLGRLDIQLWPSCVDRGSHHPDPLLYVPLWGNRLFHGRIGRGIPELPQIVAKHDLDDQVANIDQEVQSVLAQHIQTVRTKYNDLSYAENLDFTTIRYSFARDSPTIIVAVKKAKPGPGHPGPAFPFKISD